MESWGSLSASDLESAIATSAGAAAAGASMAVYGVTWQHVATSLALLVSPGALILLTDQLLVRYERFVAICHRVECERLL